MAEQEEKTTSRILNTQMTSPTEGVDLFEYFQKSHRFGAYAVLKINLTLRERVKIIVGQNHEWIKHYLSLYFKKSIDKLNIKEIGEFIHFIQKEQKMKRVLINLITLAPYKRLDHNKLHLFYLEDIYHQIQYRPLVENIVGQILLERFSKRESRLVSVVINKQGSIKKHWLVLIQSKRKKTDFQIWDPSHQYNELNDQVISELDTTLYLEGIKYNIEILPADLIVELPSDVWNPKTNEFTVINSIGKEMTFQVLGRTPAERRFRQEDHFIHSTKNEDFVPIEIGFYPYWYRLGHTTMRIGEALYELTLHGWKRHYEEGDKARAFIFNNPFFKTQIRKYGSWGMPSLAFGCTISVKKNQVEQIQLYLDRLCNAKGKEREKFSLLYNSCNQGIMKAFEHASIPGFSSKGYLGFSSILSFRKLLLNPQVPVQGLYIYPLPGNKITPYMLRSSIPGVLYKYHTLPMEILRAWFFFYFKVLYFRTHSLSNYFKKKWPSKKPVDKKLQGIHSW